MTALVERPDLSQRTALSKSVLAQFDLCATKVWFGIHDPQPFVPNEKVTFGSAVDAGVEVILKYARMGSWDATTERDHATAAAEEVIERDQVDVDILDVKTAIAAFVVNILPSFDWKLCALQPSITATLEGLGECNGHPDIILSDGSVFDVKTSGRAKEVPSLELGFYALLVEEFDPTRKVPRVGYLNYIRSKRPFWQVVEAPVTDELRRWAYEKGAAYVRARKADVALNERMTTPANFTMTGSAKFAGLCSDCEYGPSANGPCLVSFRGEEVVIE